MVATIVVTFNRLAYLKDLIGSLRAQTYGDNAIVVVNNGSTDGTSEWLATQEGLTVISQPNVGGAGGFFTGLKYAAEHGFDHCWIMDDDVLCRPDSLAELMAAMDARPHAGFVCSRVVGESGKAMNVPSADTRGLPNGDYPDTYDLVVSHGMVKVLSATFVSVLIPTAMLRKHGLPLRQFFIWCDDTEFTLRLSHSEPCYIACRSVVTHRRANESRLSFLDERDPRRLRNYHLLYRNRYVYRRRWEEGGSAIKAFIFDVKTIFRLLLRLDFRHAAPIARGVWESLWFHPRVEFPAEMIDGKANHTVTLTPTINLNQQQWTR